MESQALYTADPSLLLTEYHIRRMSQAFFGLGAQSAYLFLEKDLVFRVGLNLNESVVRSWITQEPVWKEEREEERLYSWKESQISEGKGQCLFFRFPHKDLFVWAVLYQEKMEEFPKVRWNYLSQTILTFLSVTLSKRDKSLLSFRSFAEVFRKKVLRSLESRESGVLALFYLQDLSPFFKPLGIVKSQEILREVSSTLQSATHEEELFFQLNVRSIYLFSPSETVESIANRLEGLYFPSKHMILDYKLKLYPVTRPIAENPNEFCDLFMENV
ncbi:hypothetical protein LPTSP4_04660 [Leptospira ryugenii]|uniref:Uncharacterized protein n=1 Tax=Leptospira ryugenii TaxID=1917863 RepID=A0A2P2DWL1_9LEPT|nr:hypothetical protein [Leptospira ryugenii]GBF48960.1 hypothetical protein LPTSP4_04660 [Leptospira ryugenii]